MSTHFESCSFAISYDIDTAIGQILLADVDIALICHKGPDNEAACEKIRRALGDDANLRQLGRRPVERILRLKSAYLKGRWASECEMSVDR